MNAQGKLRVTAGALETPSLGGLQSLLNPKPETRNPKPQTPNPKPQTLKNPKPTNTFGAQSSTSGFPCKIPNIQPRTGLRVQGLGFRVWGLGFRVWGLGFRVWGHTQAGPAWLARSTTPSTRRRRVPCAGRSPPIHEGLGFRVQGLYRV